MIVHVFNWSKLSKTVEQYAWNSNLHPLKTTKIKRELNKVKNKQMIYAVKDFNENSNILKYWKQRQHFHKQSDVPSNKNSQKTEWSYSDIQSLKVRS